MNVTPRKREQMDIRRAAVARYKAMGYGLDAICDAITAEGIRPRSGKRWGRATIAMDLEYLRARYTLNADADIARWIEAELETLRFAMQTAVQAVADKSKVVVGYRHVQRRDPATGALQEIKEPIFETVENLAALDRVVKIAESRRRLLAIDKVYKMQEASHEEMASKAADRIAEVFRGVMPPAPALSADGE